MSRKIVVVEPSTPIKRVAEIMYENKIRGIVVVDSNSRIAGIFTERDFVRVVALGIDLSLLIGKVMTTPIITVSPKEGLAAVVIKVIENRIQHIPIVDETNRSIGMVSIRDILRAYIACCSML